MPPPSKPDEAFAWSRFWNLVFNFTLAVIVLYAAFVTARDEGLFLPRWAREIPAVQEAYKAAKKGH